MHIVCLIIFYTKLLMELIKNYIFQVWFGHSNVVLNTQKTQQPGAMFNSIIIVCAKKSSSNREIHHYNVEIMNKR